MTREETTACLALIKACFPNFNPDMNNPSFVIDVWTDILADFTCSEVSGAIKEFAMTNTSGFAPSIGQIINIITVNRERAVFEAIERRLTDKQNARLIQNMEQIGGETGAVSN